MKSLQEYKKLASSLFGEYTQLISNHLSLPPEDRDDFLHMLIVEFKNEIEMLLVKFRNEHGGDMVELDFYTLYIKMAKENVKICDSFVERVAGIMSYNLCDNQDPRNMIKRCPNCGLIWFKTEGCDGSTTCGNRVSNYYDILSKPWWKYQLRRINGKLQWTRTQKTQISLSVRTNNNSINNRQGNRQGCGQNFIWSELPKIEDELILKLFKVKTIEQAKKLIQEDANFDRVRR